MNRRIRHVLGRAVTALFCVASVPVLVISLVRWSFGVPLSEFRPFLNDEVSYWHQAFTFSQVGFRGGYYTLGELTNPSGFTPFGPHGPGFSVLYGLFGSSFGWHRHSPLVVNLIAIAAATWVWVRVSRLSIPRLWLSSALLVTFWPMILWAPTGMQEALHNAGAIAMAGMFTGALSSEPRRFLTTTGWIVLSVLTYIRPTWSVLLPLWAFITSRDKPLRTIAVAVVGSLLLTAVLVWLYSRSTAPFPTGFFFLRVLDLSAGSSAIWKNLRFNLIRTVDLGEYTPLEVLMRAQYWGWLAAVIVFALFAARHRTKRQRPPALSYFLLAICSTSAALVLMLLLYTLTNRAEHRVLSAFLLFGALLVAASPGRSGPWISAALIASNLATTTLFLKSFEVERHENFIWDRRGVYELSDAIEGRIVYRANATRWCNTLLTAQYPPHLIAIPAGIGLSVVREPDEMRLPPRSHYLLLDESAIADFRGPLMLKALARLPYGTLYLNLESGCE